MSCVALTNGGRGGELGVLSSPSPAEGGGEGGGEGGVGAGSGFH